MCVSHVIALNLCKLASTFIFWHASQVMWNWIRYFFWRVWCWTCTDVTEHKVSARRNRDGTMIHCMRNPGRSLSLGPPPPSPCRLFYERNENVVPSQYWARNILCLQQGRQSSTAHKPLAFFTRNYPLTNLTSVETNRTAFGDVRVHCYVVVKVSSCHLPYDSR